MWQALLAIQNILQKLKKKPLIDLEKQSFPCPSVIKKWHNFQVFRPFQSVTVDRIRGSRDHFFG